jgi:Leucine-rich repeat (LRR) protein
MCDQSAAPFSVSRYDNTFSKIDCDGKGCNELPDAIFILKSVSHLSASGNKITNINPKICNLWQLKSLDLSANCITVLAPEIGLLCCLNLLSLQFNAFSQIPVQLCMLSNLRVLRLEGNLQLTYIPCELALCTQLLQLHADGCTSLKFPRAKSVFGKPPVVPWLTFLKHDSSMNVMNYLKAMLAITAFCATGKKRVADFSEICGADLQALGQFEFTPWHQGTESKYASITITTEVLLPFVSEESFDKDFEHQANQMLSADKNDRSHARDFENGSLESAKAYLQKRFPQICCKPVMENAINLLEKTPFYVDRTDFDSILSKLIMIHRICTVLGIVPTDELEFSLYEKLGHSHVAARLSKLHFYCSSNTSVPKNRNDIFEKTPDTFVDLLARLRSQGVVACHAISSIELLLDGTTLFQQNRSSIIDLRFNRTEYVAKGDIACALPNVQCINIDFNNVPKLKITSSSTRLHTLSLKSCRCQEVTVSESDPIELKSLYLSKNDLIKIDGSFQCLSRCMTWLDLSQNKLVALPSVMETFCDLKCLNCSNNLIEIVSVDFKHLTNLKILNLSNNRITAINDGLLHFAAECTVAENSNGEDVVLDLSGNLIAELPTGTELILTSQSSPFKNVTKFFLGHNPFCIFPSDFFLQLEHLQTMDFHNFKKVVAPMQPVLLSGISGVRRWFSLVAKCHESGHLDLRNYQLDKIEQAVLEECTDLTSLDLSNNAFTQVPLVLNLLIKNMHTLIFDNNSLTSASEFSSFPPELSCLTLLRLISLQHCGLTKFPDTLFTLDQLCILKLSFNAITYLHPKLCFLTSLVELDMHGCPISFPQPSIMNSTLPVIMSFLKTFSRNLPLKHEQPIREPLQCCHIDYDWEMLQIQWNGCGPAPVPLRCQPPIPDLRVSEYSVVWVRNRELKQEWNLSHFPLPCVTENTFWETCTTPFRTPDDDHVIFAQSEESTVCILMDARPLHLVRVELSKAKETIVDKKVATLSNCGVVFTDIPKSISETLLQLCLSFNENLSKSWINCEGQLSLPDSIRSMTSLRVLCLRSCKLDSVPFGLDYLQSLVDLDLSANNIFTIPVEIRKLKELRRLVLDSNPLHAWPPALRSFVKLELLSMQKCRLREIASTHLQTLTSLTSLRLDLNLFNSFPTVFNSRLRALSLNAVTLAPANLSCFLEHSCRLRMLSLSRCKLRHLPSEISFASSLVDLSIDDNEISSLPYSFGMCVSMYRLQTSENQISFPPVHLLEKDTIQNGLSLLRAFDDAVFSKNLVLDCIPLQFIPSESAKLQSLTSISACECGLLQFGDCLEFFPHLTSIFFNTNLIERLPWYIKDMTSLKKMELFHNPLEFPPVEYVESHTLDEVRTFVAACFTASQEGFIALSYKSFDSVPSYVFYCDSITSLDLSHNFLDAIPNNITVFTSLRTLNVSYNKLSFINPLIAMISTLQFINTAGNVCQNVPIQVFDADDSGEFLIIYLKALLRAHIMSEEDYLASQLKLDAIDGETGPMFVGFTFDAGSAFETITFCNSIPLFQKDPNFVNTNRCETLDITEANWFSRQMKSSALSPYAQGQLIDIVKQQLAQKTIDLSGACLLLIPKSICSTLLGANILEIRLDNNELTVLPLSLFESTAHLQSLSARSNWLISIPVQAAKHCPKLAFLDLAHNRFESAPSQLNECKNLTFLDLSYNCVKFLCSNCFAKCTSLTELHIHFNPIEALPSFWTDLHCIKYLGIQGCINLRALPCTLASTKKLHDLDICSTTMDALQTPASYIWKGGFAAVKRFLSKICACVEGGSFDMSNMNVQSLPLHLMSSTFFPAGHTCNQTDVGTSDMRLIQLQNILQHVKEMPILGLSNTKMPPTTRCIERRKSILETAESLPPGYDSAKIPENLTSVTKNQLLFDEYVTPKQKLVSCNSATPASSKMQMSTILPSALVLDFNPIMNVSLSQKQCEDLCNISLNDCGLADLPALVPTWDSLTSLHTISLDNNLFKAPPSYGLGQLGPSLTQLSMSGCRLEEFPDILLVKLPFLRHLNVESNNLKVMPDAIAHLTCLTTLRMSENHFSSIEFDVFANMSLNELTLFQQKHIHTKGVSFFQFMDGIASRRGSITLAWNRMYTWSMANLEDLQPWIAKHLEPKVMLPITTPVAFQSEANAYFFKEGSNWELLRKDWQRHVRMNMLSQ